MYKLIPRMRTFIIQQVTRRPKKKENYNFLTSKGFPFFRMLYKLLPITLCNYFEK